MSLRAWSIAAVAIVTLADVAGSQQTPRTDHLAAGGSYGCTGSEDRRNGKLYVELRVDSLAASIPTELAVVALHPAPPDVSHFLLHLGERKFVTQGGPLGGMTCELTGRALGDSATLYVTSGDDVEIVVVRNGTTTPLAAVALQNLGSETLRWGGR